MGDKDNYKLIANNKKAYFDYFIEDTWEAGIALHGTEVKSVRMGKCSIKEAFIRVEDGEVFVYNMHISPYEKGNIFNKDPLRVKKLLLHRHEVNKILGEVTQKGYTLVPLQVYLRVVLSRFRSDLDAARSSMIREILLPRRISEEKLRRISRLRISTKIYHIHR